MAETQADELDLGRLADWGAANIAGFRGPLTATRFAGGQSNPTYRLTSPSGDYVLRRKPPGVLLPSAHQVDREYRVMKALQGTAVPVPPIHALCRDDGVIGSMFFVMGYVPGRVFMDARMPGVTPDHRAAVYDSMNATIAALHSVDPEAVGLGDFGRPGAYMARQIARWSKQYRASETDPIPAMDALIDWLGAYTPPEDRVAIVHGDYRLDNLLLHPTEPRGVALLDWELATLGDPIADFAYHVMIWRITPELFRGLAGNDLAALGIPDEASYVAAYCRRTGRSSLPDWEYYIVYGMFRIAAILQGIAKRALDGTAAAADATDLGRRARPLADQAWAIARAARR
jgi:aminoglycoside phosphotransferase (APT) family kinase protein